MKQLHATLFTVLSARSCYVFIYSVSLLAELFKSFAYDPLPTRSTACVDANDAEAQESSHLLSEYASCLIGKLTFVLASKPIMTISQCQN